MKLASRIEIGVRGMRHRCARPYGQSNEHVPVKSCAFGDNNPLGLSGIRVEARARVRVYLVFLGNFLKLYIVPIFLSNTGNTRGPHHIAQGTNNVVYETRRLFSTTGIATAAKTTFTACRAKKVHGRRAENCDGQC